MLKNLGSFLRDESGAAVMEYSLIISLVALAVLLVFQDLGTALNDTMSEVTVSITSIMDQDQGSR